MRTLLLIGYVLSITFASPVSRNQENEEVSEIRDGNGDLLEMCTNMHDKGAHQRSDPKHSNTEIINKGDASGPSLKYYGEKKKPRNKNSSTNKVISSNSTMQGTGKISSMINSGKHLNNQPIKKDKKAKDSRNNKQSDNIRGEKRKKIVKKRSTENQSMIDGTYLSSELFYDASEKNYIDLSNPADSSEFIASIDLNAVNSSDTSESKTSSSSSESSSPTDKPTGTNELSEQMNSSEFSSSTNPSDVSTSPPDLTVSDDSSDSNDNGLSKKTNNISSESSNQSSSSESKDKSSSSESSDQPSSSESTDQSSSSQSSDQSSSTESTDQSSSSESTDQSSSSESTNQSSSSQSSDQSSSSESKDKSSSSESSDQPSSSESSDQSSSSQSSDQSTSSESNSDSSDSTSPSILSGPTETSPNSDEANNQLV